MLFNFFQKNKDSSSPDPEVEINADDVVAKLTYCVLKDSESPVVDIELMDYNDSSIHALCHILDIIASDKSLTETIEIIKNAMISEGQEKHLIKIFSYINQNTKTKMLNVYNDRLEDEPCIRPSDISMWE